MIQTFGFAIWNFQHVNVTKQTIAEPQADSTVVARHGFAGFIAKFTVLGSCVGPPEPLQECGASLKNDFARLRNAAARYPNRSDNLPARPSTLRFQIGFCHRCCPPLRRPSSPALQSGNRVANARFPRRRRQRRAISGSVEAPLLPAFWRQGSLRYSAVSSNHVGRQLRSRRQRYPAERN